MTHSAGNSPHARAVWCTHAVASQCRQAGSIATAEQLLPTPPSSPDTDPSPWLVAAQHERPRQRRGSQEMPWSLHPPTRLSSCGSMWCSLVYLAALNTCRRPGQRSESTRPTASSPLARLVLRKAWLQGITSWDGAGWCVGQRMRVNVWCAARFAPTQSHTRGLAWGCFMGVQPGDAAWACLMLFAA